MPETVVVAKNDSRRAQAEIVRAARAGAVFVYPTDTVYGIGCDARKPASVERIRKIKKRNAEKPFSVIAPSKTWIARNCFVPQRALDSLALLPGPYTLVFELKRKRCVARETNAGLATLGVRIPKHWIAEVARKAGAPIVTTSVNESGAPPARTLAEIKKVLKNEAVDLIVFEGALRGEPSRVIDFSNKNWSITRK